MSLGPFDLYPAIDIRDGNCVRLYQGDYDKEVIYGSDPAAQAQAFVNEGAGWIHVVDLDAARSGEQTNLAAISAVAEVASRGGAKLEVGGGVRSVEAALRLADAGVDRVVIGTAAIEQPELVSQVAEKMAVAVGLDAWGSDVAVAGWERRTGRDLFDTVRSFADSGVAAFVVTEIARDGTMTGPDVEGLSKVLATTSVPVVASGGVGTLDDVVALAGVEVEGRGLAGVIVGRAIYENAFTVAAAIEAINGISHPQATGSD